MARHLPFYEAVNKALFMAMELDESVICYGLGVDDPKGVFGTTLGLKDRFGEQRVFDMPTSENAMTGVAIGASLNGVRPVMVHQRLDFILLALDQLVNNAAKWHYMYGGRAHVPITIRSSIGRGWGQGPTHSQHFQALFSQIPGLKVVMPTTAGDAKGLLLSSIFDDNPVIFLEHRWLHNLSGEVPEGDYRIPIGKARHIKNGTDVSIISYSHMTIEAIEAIDFLEEHSVSCDLIDLRTVKPIDWKMIFRSVRKTGRLLALDTGPGTGSIASEIIARVSMECFGQLKGAPRRIALPDFPTPTSQALTRVFYKRSVDIVGIIGDMLDRNIEMPEPDKFISLPHDVPGEYFKGPF